MPLPSYADVLLPLALPGVLTYHLPAALAAQVVVGSRVVVPLGKSKRYTAIVVRLHEHPRLAAGVVVRDIEEVVDAEPLLTAAQIDFWRWLSSYYLCHPGEVMKAALPSGLKLESETTFALADDTTIDAANDEGEERVLRHLDKGKSTLTALQKAVPQRGTVTALRRLVETGRVVVGERMAKAYTPKTERYLRLAPEWQSEERLSQILVTMERAPRQREALTALLELSGMAAALTLHNSSLIKPLSRHDLLRHLGSGAAAAVAMLCKRGIVERYEVAVSRLDTPAPLPEALRHPLSAEQQRAYDAIETAWQTHRVCLLHGVTASGKTEVYIRLVEAAIARGEQVLYLLPEIALTTQIMTRLMRVFGGRMGIYHSRYADAERVELWRRQLSPEAFPLILGARSALLLPYRRLGLIIVDEEHEPSYKQQDPAPRYHARDAAIMLAHQCGAHVLLGTATPTLETYSHALSGKYALVELRHRYGEVQLPEIVVEDVKELRRKRLMPTPFAPRLVEATRDALSRGEQAIYFQNRRGYAPLLECRDCGWVPRCAHCDVSLTFHQGMGRLVCHYCGAQYAVPAACPSCGRAKLRDMGYGTEKIEAAARAVFEGVKTARMDLDTTRSRDAYAHIIEDFARGRSDLLIGTQMVTKGLDFERVSVVGILSADQVLAQPHFRAHERAFQMLSQVAGRAGRRGKRGLVVLQTRQAEAPVVQQVVAGDYAAMYRQQMAERQAFRFPPFVRLIDIYVKHRSEATAAEAASRMAALLRPRLGSDLLGPDKPAVGRIQLLYIRKLMVKIAPSQPLDEVKAWLQAARREVVSSDDCKGVGIYFDVDPV